VWHEAEHGDPLAEAREASRWRPGIAWPRPDLCAITPVAADPAVCDAALAVARELLARTGDGLRMVVLPGTVEHRGDHPEVLPDPLLTDLDRQAPEVPAGAVFLTSRAADRLEIPRRLEKVKPYQGPSGSRAPLLRAWEEDVRAPVFRNPSVLRRRVAYVPRPELDTALLRRPAVVRVTGLPGSGKSRAVWQAVRGGGLILWVTARPVRHHHPLLAAQILHRLLHLGTKTERLEGLDGLGIHPETLGPDFVRLLTAGGAPGSLADSEEMGRCLPRWLGTLAADGGASPTLVVDNLEAACTTDLALVNHLLDAALDGGPLRLVLLSRSGTPWPTGWSAPPEIEVPLLAEEEMEALAQGAFAGLDFPRQVREELLTHAAGNPFALEEALAALVHKDLIRQVYGSFFFSGHEDTPYPPSERLIQHVEADARRLGSSELLRLLAVSGMAVPAEVLARAGGCHGWVDSKWVELHREAGWVRNAPSAWGGAVELTIPAFRLALAATLPVDAARRLRGELGRILETPSSRSTWQRYQLLARTQEAPAALLAAVEDPETPPEELVVALTGELERLREVGGNEDLEGDLLWHLLPLVHQFGRLGEHREDLARALRLASDNPHRHLAFTGLEAELAEQEGRLREAEESIRRALKKDRGPEHKTAEAVLIIRLGRLLLRQERYEEARKLLEKVAPVLAAEGATRLVASCHFYLGNVALHQDRLEHALELHQQALEARRHHDKPRAVGASLSALGRVTLRLGHYPEAIAYYQEAERLFTECGQEGELSFALLGLGKALSRLGSHVSAATPLRQALSLREAQSDTAGVAIARLAVAENHLQLRRLEAALREARKAHFDLQLLPTQIAACAEAERLLGRILLVQRQHEKAVQHLEHAVALHRRLNNQEDEVVDRAWQLEAALAGEDEAAIRQAVDQLEVAMATGCYLEQREVAEHRLFRARTWLVRAGDDPGRPLPYLRRSYRELLTKASHLSRAQRHSFLHQIPDHRAIVADATEHGLSWPDLPIGPAEL